MDLGTTVNEAYNAYQSLMQHHSHIGSMLSAEVTVVTGDALSQLIKDHRVDRKKIAFSAALAPLYGICLEGLVETGELVGKYFSQDSFTKGALGPNLWGNFYNTFFFVNNTVGEKTGYKLKELGKHYYRLLRGEKGEGRSGWQEFKEWFKKEYLANVPHQAYEQSVLWTLTVWNGLQWFNYEHVSEQMRTPATLLEGVAWMTILSMLSLTGRREVVAEEQAQRIKEQPHNNL